MSDLDKQFVVAVAGLREGEVVSFGHIANRAGAPNAPRAAGRFLSKTKLSVPWWRVVYSDGRIPSCNIPRQNQHLESEGVTLIGNKVVNAPHGRFS